MKSTVTTKVSDKFFTVLVTQDLITVFLLLKWLFFEYLIPKITPHFGRLNGLSDFVVLK